MSDIFQKTTLGLEEIANRSRGLSARMRRCLILIDGKRSTLDLMKTLQGEELSPLIQTLEIEGYIELIGSAPNLYSKPSLSQVMGADTSIGASQLGAFPESQPLFIDSSGQMRKPLGVAERKSRAVRVINELLGPNGDTFALKIEATKDGIELEKALHTAANFISNQINAVAAKRFRDHIRLSDSA
jgi:hypothetical protein